MAQVDMTPKIQLLKDVDGTDLFFSLSIPCVFFTARPALLPSFSTSL
jgi:hypothetical protein